MINVALELSTVGLGQSDKKDGKNRTGLFRVNTELTKALLAKSGIHYYLFFWAYPHVSQFGMQYFRERGFNLDSLFDNSPLEEFVYQQLFNSNKIAYKHTFMRMASRIFKACKHPSPPNHVDIFHSLYYPLPNLINPKYKIRFRTIHDLTPLLMPQLFPEGHRKKFLRGIRKISSEHDWFFAVSNHTKSALCHLLKIPEERVFVTPLAACRKKFRPVKDKNQISSVKKILNIPDKPYLLSLATLEPRKNLRFAIRAFKKFIHDSKDDPGVILVLVGRKGWLIDKLFNDINTDPILKGRVVLAGFVPDLMLAPLLSGAVAFVYPSLYEGFGLPVLEAMQCGTPVVSSNTSSLPEVVGDAGILIDPKNEDEMCQALIDLSNDEDLRHSLSKTGIERAGLFSWEKSAEATLSAYRFAMDHQGC